MVITESLILYSNLYKPSKILPKSVWASSSLFVIKPLSRDSQKERLGLEISIYWIAYGYKPREPRHIISRCQTTMGISGPIRFALGAHRKQIGPQRNLHHQTTIQNLLVLVSARFSFLCPVLFPHVESLATSHQITQPSAIPAGRGTNVSVLLCKAGGAINVTTVNIFRVIFVLPTPPASGTEPCQRESS